MMGVGPLEMGVILLVAFLVLGPAKSIEMARTVGKVMRDIRRVSSEIMAAADLNLDEKPKPREQSNPPTSPGVPTREEPPPTENPNERQ